MRELNYLNKSADSLAIVKIHGVVLVKQMVGGNQGNVEFKLYKPVFNK